MNSEEEFFFDALVEDRRENAQTLKKPSMRGIKKGVVEKYSDQAHFIYELLQNADDAGATSVGFQLSKGKLIFRHNGKRHFSITNPETEDIDAESGRLGDLNAITSVANSNKTKNESKIGKFGLGFKAVFQYTETPYIYDSNFLFKIEDLFVPSRIANDFPGRNENETIFEFPFNHKDKSPEDSFTDISQKLQTLSYPLLFLTNLEDISYCISGTSVSGFYKREKRQTINYNNGTIGEQINLSERHGEESKENNLWLFSKPDKDKLFYSVGFFQDADGNLIPKVEPAFCYFPTQLSTGLSFLIHGPFLLTDNREGIKAGVAYNKNLINDIAVLSSDSLVYLRDIGISQGKQLINDKILDIIPTDESIFTDENNNNRISFMPFFTQIRTKFQSESILPANQKYVSSKNAYWASVAKLTTIFTDNQIAFFTNNPNANWVFTSIGRDYLQDKNKSLVTYIDSVTNCWINETLILRGRAHFYSKNINVSAVIGINSEFIENQTVDWLKLFYGWVAETNDRKEICKTLPIFLDSNGKAQAAFQKYDDTPQLFFPSEDRKDCLTVNDAFIEDKDIYKFLKEMGIKEPSLKDEIYTAIIPKYSQEVPMDDVDKDFGKFFKYYRKCSRDDTDGFIDDISEIPFLKYRSLTSNGWDKASNLYFPDDELAKYFASKPNVKFVAFEDYVSLLGEKNQELLIEFLKSIGVNKQVKIVSRELSQEQASQASNTVWSYSTNYQEWSDKVLDGAPEILAKIQKERNAEDSALLWKYLVRECQQTSPQSDYYGVYKYFYRTSKMNRFPSYFAKQLTNTSWLINVRDEWEKPDKISKNQLSTRYYNLNEPGTEELISFLGIEDETQTAKENDKYSNLSEEQREKIKTADMLLENGITPEMVIECISIIKNKKQISNSEYNDNMEPMQRQNSNSEESTKNERTFVPSPQLSPEIKQTEKLSDFKLPDPVNDIIQRFQKSEKSANYSNINESTTAEVPTEDQDELLPATIDYERRIEKAKGKSVDEIERIAIMDSLQTTALSATKYSFKWFCTLLQMESMDSKEVNSYSRKISITFGQVEMEQGTSRTLILKQPNRYIPQIIEELTDIPLLINTESTSVRFTIDAINVRSYSVYVKLKESFDTKQLDFSKVIGAQIDAKSPDFLINELYNHFRELNFDDDFNMKTNLTPNIEFIFGPPGTGKTTYLANKILIPLIQQHQKIRVLVLTPTNKSADVLTNKIIDAMGNDNSFKNWLIRFGTTTDERIEKSKVFRDKTFDIRSLQKSITVTTIARFPYDYFMPPGDRLYLRNLNWDFIVFDEASMIPIANIIYPLYKKTPTKFFIAGDPFQIEPVTTNCFWKGENIYSLVELKSFSNPQTVPYPYKVNLLTTQYRSIPDIGNVFSRFSYDGILTSFRKEESRKEFASIEGLLISPLTIIKFPVSNYESIYRAKRLQDSSPYQIYSALFTFEFANFLSNHIICKAGQIFKIGIIAPYRAQADIIEKLILSTDKKENTEIQVGTIHGFQGDECDMIIDVFNPPPLTSISSGVFLNNQNIINVSISRARDYLIVLIPDNETKGIELLRLINSVEEIMKSSPKCIEYNSHCIEQLMFSNPNYIEDNSFSTSHQSINVYGLPDKKYEIRSEDSAVDIQIHQEAKTDITINNNQMNANQTEKKTECITIAWLDSKKGTCPLDGGSLETKGVTLTRKDGSKATINMQVCSKCNQKYIRRVSAANTISANDFNVVFCNIISKK